MNLTNHFLVAMPTITDPVFSGTVVYLCVHNDRGALGMVINRPLDLTVGSLLEKLDLKPDILTPVNMPVMFGGPVEEDHGFVLHPPLSHYESMLTVTDDVAFTSSRDIMEAIATGTAPKRILPGIGYSCWDPGQLEYEISQNGWLTVKADPAIIFDLPIHERYTAAIRLLGFDPSFLTVQTGHA